MKPKVLFVDWDGTLSNSRFWEGCSEPALTPEVVSRFTNFLFVESKQLIPDWMRGKFTSEQITQIVAQRFELDAQLLYRELENSCRNMKFISKDIPDKIKKIQQNGIKVVIATDNMDTFSKWTVPALGLDTLFDGILNSHSRGALKADLIDGHSPFFGQFLSQQAIKPYQSVLIDNGENSATFEFLGIDFSHIDASHSLVTALDSFAIVSS